MKWLLRLLLGANLVLAFGNLAKADTVTFEFNPVDFFDFKDWGVGPQSDGGMLRLHETGGFLGAATHDSWTAAGSSVLTQVRAGLDDDPRPEGIGYVQVYLLKEPSPGGTQPVENWGQSLTAAGSPMGTAPTGWSALGASESAAAWVYQWEAGSIEYLIRPGRDYGNFTLSFPANETVRYGNRYTLWFGGDNYSGFAPAIDFGPFPGGDFEAATPNDQPGTAYEATRSLIAVPEPATFIELLGLAVSMSIMVWWRRDRVIRRW